MSQLDSERADAQPVILSEAVVRKFNKMVYATKASQKQNKNQVQHTKKEAKDGHENHSQSEALSDRLCRQIIVMLIKIK